MLNKLRGAQLFGFLLKFNRCRQIFKSPNKSNIYYIRASPESKCYQGVRRKSFCKQFDLADMIFLKLQLNYFKNNCNLFAISSTVCTIPAMKLIPCIVVRIV